MPANVVCRWTKEPVNSHIWCWMQYSHACHYYLKRDGVSKTLDWLLIDSNVLKWQPKGTIAVIRQFYPHAMHDPRLKEIAKRHNLEELVISVELL